MAYDQLRTLQDIEAIKVLRARYCRCADEKDWEGFRACFTDDATIEVHGMPTRTADQHTASARANLTTANSLHLCLAPEIEITSPDTATGRWRLIDYAEWLDEKPRARQGYGKYVDGYRREESGWKIAETRYEKQRNIWFPADAAWTWPEVVRIPPPVDA